jgi:hypothetical protein
MWCCLFYDETDMQLLRMLCEAKDMVTKAQRLGWDVAFRLMKPQTHAIEEDLDRPYFENGSPLSFVIQYYSFSENVTAHYKEAVYYREVARRVRNVPPLPTKLFDEVVQATNAACALWVYNEMRMTHYVGSQQAFFVFVLHVRMTYKPFRKYYYRNEIDVEKHLFRKSNKTRKLSLLASWEHMDVAQKLCICIQKYATYLRKAFGPSCEKKKKKLCGVVHPKNILVHFMSYIMKEEDVHGFVTCNTTAHLFLKHFLLTIVRESWGIHAFELVQI